ncbi:MAG: NAD-dependent epimerase/dehydratase family protein [Nanoarchaeota archaeon]|nr:NAD-dependent epimerase/dehydratase family protein [Nanoarchaeota archaeon]
MKCLVTGGAGFIGSQLVKRLIKEGHQVIVLDNLSTGKAERIPKKAIFIRADIRDDLESILLKYPIDIVFHLAAETSVRKSLMEPMENVDVNIQGSINLIDFCLKKKVKKIIFSSSAAVYDSSEKIPVEERARTNPINMYGITKLAIENYIKSVKETKGLEYVILRYSNVFGPGQSASGEAGVITIFFNNALQNSQINIFGDGEQTRDFVYIEDVVAANLKAINLTGTFNVSANREKSIKDLVNQIVNLTKSKSEIFYQPPIQGELKKSRLNNKKLLSTGWKPSIDFDEGLLKILDHLKKEKIEKVPRKIKILELTNYSAGGCGVFARVKNEAQILANKGYEVAIFSSNLEKGTDKIMPQYDRLGEVLIQRFPARKLGGESFMLWNFEKEALKFKPDIIFAHSYRHLHTVKAISIAKKINAKVYLVTHAPFGRSKTRNRAENIVVSFYDSLFSKSYLNKFNKIIAISHWELPYLKDLGISKEKIEYIPNGISEQFFTEKTKSKEENKIVYLGRISPIKNLETPLEAMNLVKDPSLKCVLYGPAEEDYLKKLRSTIARNKIEKKVTIINKRYNASEQIEELDSAKMYILPSISEGMPQSLIEAMARGKIVLASDIPATRDLIKPGKNGFLFPIGDEKALGNTINKILSMNKSEIEKIRNAAKNDVKIFEWGSIIKKIESLV